MLSDENKLRIFSGNANPDLAREIAAYLGTTVGDAVINRFNNGEVQVMINESVRGKDIFIVQPTCGPSVNDNVMELLIMADAFKRASASHITAIIPYYGYARQDRKARGREPITAKLMADLLESAGITRVVTIDLHAAQIQGFFNIPFDHMPGGPILAEYIKEKNLDEARKVYRQMLPLLRLLEDTGELWQVVKHSLALKGFGTGKLRLPRQPISEEVRIELEKVLKQADFC